MKLYLKSASFILSYVHLGPEDFTKKDVKVVV